MCCGSDIFLGLLAILFPPLAVWVKRGLCSADSLLNILLCVLGYIPGLLHAWYVIARYPEDEGAYYEGLPEHNESGHVTYVFVQHPAGGPGQPQTRVQQQQPRRQPKPQAQGAGMNYGTTSTATSSSAPVHDREEANGGEGGSSGANNLPPPTYAEAVKGDNKIQTHD